MLGYLKRSRILLKTCLSTSRTLTAFCLGALLGFIAGLIGVGGGEFRIPILIYVLRLPAVTAVAVNLFIGLLTVVFSFLRRFQLGLLTRHGLNIAIAMVPTSIIGAYMGAVLTGRVSEKLLKKALAVLLVIVGFKIGLEPFTSGFAMLNVELGFLEGIVLATLVGLAIGIICGSLGVAGGEFRIPVLIYVFSLDIVEAGTASLLVSIPAVASGFLKHQTMGHMDRETTTVAVVMGLGSILGALTGASYAGTVEKDLLKILLGMILVLATVRMMTKP
jgi:uncharacterized membrane protein YfcA